MSKKVSIDDLSKAILEELKNYEGVTEEAAWKGVSDTSQTALKKLRSAHPAGSGEYGSWDKYNRGWTVMKTKRDKKATIHNATDYRLTHLLEKGHAKRNGGRTRAFPHIAPVEEKCEENLIKNIKKNI